MNTYAFILGRKHLLSIAEICNVLKKEDRIIDLRPEVLIAELHTPLADAQKSLDKLGGTIKIAQIFAEIPSDSTNQTVASAISQRLIEIIKDQTTKFSYGVSAYSLAQKHEIFLKNILNNIKKNLVANELKSRFINNNFKNPENAAIKGEKLLIKGAEIIVFQGNHKLFIGRTEALQDFESYGKRDFERPARDAKLGMLPPKLAQIMINLSGLNTLDTVKYVTETPHITIFDPFVGIGTIPMEALLMDYNVIGSDISQEVLDKCKKNMDWIRNEYYNPGQKMNLFQTDATTLNKDDLPDPVSAVVTESFLGPPMAVCPPPEEIHKIFAKISETLYRFFKAIYNCVPKNTPIVISFPVYRRQDRFFFIENLVDKIIGIGYSIESLIPKEISTRYDIRSYDRESLIYDRPEQIVGREIWKFIRK
jgi:tRNA G10  N-methylase Trm11